VAGLRERAIAGMRRHPALSIDHRHLANLAMLIGEQQARERLGRGTSRAHQVEAERSVTRIDEGLRRDGADFGFRMNDNRANREPMRLDRGAELTGIRIARNNRIGVCKSKVRHRTETTKAQRHELRQADAGRGAPIGKSLRHGLPRPSIRTLCAFVPL